MKIGPVEFHQIDSAKKNCQFFILAMIENDRWGGVLGFLMIIPIGIPTCGGLKASF